MNLFLRFVKYLLPYKAKWVFILIFSGLTALLGLVNPYLTKLVIDKGLVPRDIKIFVVLTIIGASIFVLTGIIDSLKRYLERFVKVRIKFDLNREVFRRIQYLPFRWFQNKSTGEHIYKISYDITRVEGLITTVPPEAVSLFPRLFVILAIILHLNWKMAVFSLCLTPLLYLPPYYFMHKRRSIWERLIKNSEQIFKVLHETFSHIYPIKVFGKEASEINKYLKKLTENIDIELKSTKFEIFNSFSASLVNKIILGLITFYGGYQVIKGTMTLGSLTAIMVYLGQLVAMQASFIMFYQTTVLGVVSCQRIADILDEEGLIKDSPKAEEISIENPEIIFNKVTFGYEVGKPVIKNLSFTIEPNKHICLVAPSGLGKTTLLNLIVRLYDPWQGEILIDGTNIQDIKLSSLKAQIGMALQEPFLFNDSVKNNILYGKEGAKEAEIVEAARFSMAHDFIKDLPGAYDAVIGENACKLSEGQKQKIAIARAMIKKPKILILDEAMSSMDSISEEKILLNIKNNLKGTTLITVSHRLSTAMAADLVYFLKKEDQIVIASYEKLLHEDREFGELFRAQIITDRDT